LSYPSQSAAQDKESQADERPPRRAENDVRESGRWNRRVLWLLMGLTLGTGIVDAVGYLALNHVFIGNMTGNVIILGMAIVGADKLPVLGPLLAMLCFSLGASVTGIALRNNPSAWPGAVTGALLLAGGLVTSMGVLSLLLEDQPDTPAQLVMFIRPNVKSVANRRAAAILAMLLGAAVGAVAVHLSTGFALLGAGLIVVVVSLLGHFATKSALAASDR